MKVDIEELNKAIGIPDISVTINKDTRPIEIRTRLVLQSITRLDPVILQVSKDESIIWSILARKIREEFLHHIYLILHDLDSRDLEQLKAIARREAYIH